MSIEDLITALQRLQKIHPGTTVVTVRTKDKEKPPVPIDCIGFLDPTRQGDRLVGIFVDD